MSDTPATPKLDSLPDTEKTEGYASSSSRQALSPGAILADKYRIVRHLGEGGMGAVYEAEHIKLGRRVALKLLHAELRQNAEVLARFVTEARAVSALRHRHIIKVEDFLDEHSEQPAIVMEFVVGKTVADAAPLDVDAARELLAQVAGALAAVHDAGFVHRDLKAENVMLLDTEDGAVDARVLDFGIVKLMAAQPERFSVAKTATGILLGTPHYMAPEVFDGKPVSNATDIYAFGVFAYVALTGCTPFEGDSVGQLAVAHMTLAPPSVKAKRPAFADPSLEALVAFCMAKDPQDRPTSMNDIVTALRGKPEAKAPERLTSMGVAPAPGEGEATTARTPLGIVAAVAVLLLVVLVGYVVWPADDVSKSPPPPKDVVADVVAPPAPGTPPEVTSSDVPPVAKTGPADRDDQRLPKAKKTRRQSTRKKVQKAKTRTKKRRHPKRRSTKTS